MKTPMPKRSISVDRLLVFVLVTDVIAAGCILGAAWLMFGPTETLGPAQSSDEEIVIVATGDTEVDLVIPTAPFRGLQ